MADTIRKTLNLADYGLPEPLVFDVPKYAQGDDGQEYDDSSLSDECKGVINSLQFTKSELQRLEGMKAVLRTAEAAYSTLLKEKLPK